MIKPINNNKYFKFFQPKLFYICNDIDKDDPVRTLSVILEEMDFSNLLQVFPNKTKVHPVNMFAIIIYAYHKANILQGIFNFFVEIVKELNTC